VYRSKNSSRIFRLRGEYIRYFWFIYEGLVEIAMTHMVPKILRGNRGTVASAVIQAIGSGINEETLMKATHPMIRPVWHLHQADLDYRILLTHLDQP
jgi:hypothetical protein